MPARPKPAPPPSPSARPPARPPSSLIVCLVQTAVHCHVPKRSGTTSSVQCRSRPAPGSRKTVVDSCCGARPADDRRSLRNTADSQVNSDAGNAVNSPSILLQLTVNIPFLGVEYTRTGVYYIVIHIRVRSL